MHSPQFALLAERSHATLLAQTTYSSYQRAINHLAGSLIDTPG